VSLHHVGEQGSAVLGWRLYLPESWANDRERRKEAGVPDDVVFKTKWQLALDLIDQARGWNIPDRLVVADAGYGDATEFRDGLRTEIFLMLWVFPNRLAYGRVRRRLPFPNTVGEDSRHRDFLTEARSQPMCINSL